MRRSLVVHLFALVLLLSLIHFFANAEEYIEPSEVVSTEGLPSNLVNRSVCVISGEYTDCVQDLVVAGPEPLTLHRFYGSQTDGGWLDGGWCFNHHESIICSTANSERGEIYVAGVRQPSGSMLDYTRLRSKNMPKTGKVQFELEVPKGLTNGAGRLSGRTNIKNQKIFYYPEDKKIVSVSGAGNRRTFTKVFVKEDGGVVHRQNNEEKVNGCLYDYEGRGKSWDMRIVVRNQKTKKPFADVKFKNAPSDEAPLIVTASDGRELKYFFKEHKYKTHKRGLNEKSSTEYLRHYLTKVESPSAPVEEYEYREKALNKELHITSKSRPEGRFLQTSYYHI